MDNPLSARNLYQQELAGHDLLSADEERELLQRIRQGDNAALDRLVRMNQRLVVGIASRYFYSPVSGYRRETKLEMMDLIQTGNLGMLQAIHKYDPHTFPGRFSTYAVWWIRAYISRYCIRQSHPYTFSVRDGIAFRRARAAKAVLYTHLGSLPDDDAVSQAAHVPQTDLALYAGAYRYCSLDEINDRLGETQEEYLIDPASLHWQTASDVRILLQRLDEPRAGKALALRFGLDCLPHTYVQIGRELGVTGEGARQIIEKALRELRNYV